MDFATLSNYIIVKLKQLSGKQEVASLNEIINLVEENRKDLELFTKNLNCGLKHSREICTFLEFVDKLREWGMREQDISRYTDYFLFGYTIPQISKEFDLIRFGENYNINIEIKSNTSIEEQEAQLKKNYFYLNFLEVKTKYYSISPTTDNFIEYDPINKEVKPLSQKDFIFALKNQVTRNYNIEEVDNFFNIKNYLVSPFNDVGDFLKDKYFLTDHQNRIVREIMSDDEVWNFGIKGNPGTGKSLLVYHIAKKLMETGKKVVIIHGANLNIGQERLKKAGYHIEPVKNFSKIINRAEDYDYIIIDEAQRLRETWKYEQIKLLRVALTVPESKIIVSLDGNQTLSPDESAENAERIYNTIKENGKVYSLKDKFRTNPEMSSFIKLLSKIPMNKEYVKIPNKNHNIQLKFFNTRQEADRYLGEIDRNREEAVILNYTKRTNSFYYPRLPEEIDKMNNFGMTSHSVIGQEFDKVVIPMDHNFFYNEQSRTDEKTGKVNQFKILSTTPSYYPLYKMLYQNLTRTREKLEIVVIENFELFDTLCGLLERV